MHHACFETADDVALVHLRRDLARDPPDRIGAASPRGNYNGRTSKGLVVTTVQSGERCPRSVKMMANPSGTRAVLSSGAPRAVNPTEPLSIGSP